MIHSQLLDSFYLSAEQLENSPSRQDGIDRDTEINLRIYGCELIQEAGILLGFHQVVMATGQVLFHRFYCKRSMKAFNVKKVAATALWVGAKLEEVQEVSKHPRELQEKVMVTLDRCTARREMPDAAKLPVLEPGTKEYEEFRRSLIRYETEMLKAFGFITNVEHPHRLILNYIQVLGIPKAIAQLVEAGDEGDALHSFAQHAWNVANDSLRTTLCVRFKGSVVACGIILYTARVLQVPLPADWWELFQVELRDAVEVAHALHELYLAPKARFIPVCHQLLPSKPPTPGVGGGGIKVVLGATPLIGATPELGSRPGAKLLDPSVRRPLAASGSTPNLVVAAANGSAPGPSPPPAAAPGSARKRSRSRSSSLDDGRKRQQVDGSSSQQQQQPGLPPLAPSSQQALLQQQAQAAIAAITAGKERDASRDREQQRASSRHGTSGGGSSRRRSRSRSRSRERRRSRSRERDGRRRRSRSRSRERDSRRRHGSRSRSRERREHERHRGRSAERAGPARVDDRPPRSGAAGRDRGRSRDVRSPSEAKQEQPSQKLPPPPASPGGSMPQPPPPAAAAAAAAAMDGDSGSGAARGNGTGNGQQAAAAADNAAGGEQQQQQPAKAKPVAVRKKPATQPAAGPKATASPAADAEPKSTS